MISIVAITIFYTFTSISDIKLSEPTFCDGKCVVFENVSLLIWTFLWSCLIYGASFVYVF